MSFIGTAIVGSAVVGAGASIYAGQQGADAAKGGSVAQQDAAFRASQTSIAAGKEALAYLDPFRQYGLNAGASLQEALYSPQQRMGQMDAQKVQLEGEVARLTALRPNWDTYQILTGKRASERRAAMFTQENQIAQQKIAEAQAKLATFNKQYEMAKTQAAQPAPTIEASPWYQFQAELLGRTQDRAFAARGLTGSGFEAEERRRGLIELGAGETERQFGRLKGLYDVGANAATAGAGAITGTGQAVSNNQVMAGNAQAAGLQGVAGANRDMAYGISNSINSGAGMYLANKQWNTFAEGLNARNNPAAAKDPVFDSVDSRGGSYDYLRS